MHWLRPSYTALKLEISRELAYRLKIFSWVVADLLQPLIFAYLWSYVARSSGNVEDTSLYFSYFFFLMIVVRIANDWSIFAVTDSVTTGSFRFQLLRPVHYIFIVASQSLGIKIFRFAIFIPIILCIGYLWRDLLAADLTVSRAIFIVVAILIALGLNLITGNIFALLAFHLKNVQGLRTLYVNSLVLVTGEFIPIALLLPISFISAWGLLPFRYFFSFPVEIIIGIADSDQLLSGLTIGLLYLLIGIIAYVILARRSINRYEAEGG